MSDEFSNPVSDQDPSREAGAFETEAEDGPRRKKRYQGNLKGNLKGGLDAVKGGVGNITHGAAGKMGNASQLTSVKDLMKFADLAGDSTARTTIAVYVLTMTMPRSCACSFWLGCRGR